VLFLSAAAVDAAMPDLDHQLGIAERALRGVGHGAQVPGKRTLHPAPASSFGYAMPAYDPGGVNGETLGMKWVTGYPTNSLVGLPTINSLIVLNDPASLHPLAVLDGSRITASRTAAVSAVCIRQFAPDLRGRTPVVAIVGAGVQGHAHLPLLGHVLPGVRVVTFDRHADRANQLAKDARRTAGIASARSASSAPAAVEGADIVITAASFGSTSQIMTQDWLQADVLVVAVDYETYVSAELARSATMFLIDEPAGFANVKSEGRFEGFPDPDGTIGDAVIANEQWPRGRTVVCHLGMGLTDILFARAVYERAVLDGAGVELPW
jgi:ornithine cyclodeaminase/alanine dehydrogenase-like protein (mu-crystallin family)